MDARKYQAEHVTQLNWNQSHNDAMQGPMDAREYQAKHETQLIHDQLPSYDPAVYGGTYPDRFHIKTVQVRIWA